MEGGALYGEGPRGIDAVGTVMLAGEPIGGDCGRAAYGFAGGGGACDMDAIGGGATGGEVIRGGGIVPAFGGGGTEGVR